MDNLTQVNQILSLGDASSSNEPPSTSGNSSLDAVNNILSSTPSDMNNADAQLGSQTDDGFCQRFVEQQVYGKTGIFPSAAAAWNYYATNGQASGDTKNMKPGDLLYFAPDKSNEGSGHVGIYEGNGNMVSATDNGVKVSNIGMWQKQTGQQVLGYVPIK